MQEKTCLQVIQIKLRYKRQAFESEIWLRDHRCDQRWNKINGDEGRYQREDIVARHKEVVYNFQCKKDHVCSYNISWF